MQGSKWFRMVPSVHSRTSVKTSRFPGRHEVDGREGSWSDFPLGDCVHLGPGCSGRWALVSFRVPGPVSPTPTLPVRKVVLTSPRTDAWYCTGGSLRPPWVLGPSCTDKLPPTATESGVLLGPLPVSSFEPPTNSSVQLYMAHLSR